MPESAAHKKYMDRYRARKKEQKQKGEQAQEDVSAAPEWRTRRHSKRKPDGKWSTDYLFERRNQLTHYSETRSLTEEEQSLKDQIDEELRSRGELARIASSEPTGQEEFYERLYTRLGIEEYHNASFTYGEGPVSLRLKEEIKKSE